MPKRWDNREAAPTLLGKLHGRATVCREVWQPLVVCWEGLPDMPMICESGNLPRGKNLLRVKEGATIENCV